MNLFAIAALFKKDFLDARRNYQILLMVVTPVILSLIFSRVLSSGPKDKTRLPQVGILGDTDQPFLTQLSPEKAGVRAQFFVTREDLESAIIEGKVAFGLILPHRLSSDDTPGSNREAFTVVHPSGLPEHSIAALRGTIEQQLRRFLGISPPALPISFTLQAVGGRNDTSLSFSSDWFPMMVLMAMGMVGFLGLPLSFTEEKEKKTLSALFLTPLTTIDLILGKSLFSLGLIFGTVLTMVLLNGMWLGDICYFWLFVGLGSLFCIFTGLLIAMVAHNQASVNALGTPIFMFFQLIPNLARSSDYLRYISRFVPSTYFQSGIKKALFLDLSKVDIHLDLSIALVFTILIYIGTHIVLRRKATLS